MTETIKELAPYLTALADKLSTTADKVWAMQLLQAKVDTVSYGIQWVLWMAMAYALYKLWLKVYKKCDGVWEIGNGWNSESTMLFWYTVFASALLVVSFIALPSIDELVTVIVNPEYHALQSLLRMVK